MNTGPQNRLAIRSGVPSGKRTAVWISAAVLVFAGLIPFDSRIAMWLDIDHMPGDLVRAINLMELFAHGAGAVLLVVGLMIFSPSRWRESLRLILGLVLAGVVVNLIKLLVIRYRPAFFYPGFSGDEQSWIGTTWSDSASEAVLQNSKYFIDSFPSGHAAHAFALAVMLSIMFPRGRWFFGVLAALACLQRVMGHAHWTSDTVAGAAIGVFCGYIVFRFPLPGIFRKIKMAE